MNSITERVVSFLTVTHELRPNRSFWPPFPLTSFLGRRMSLLLGLFVAFTRSFDRAIIITGSPSLRKMNDPDRIARYYRLMADSFRMAQLLEANNYRVTMFYSETMAHQCNGEWQSVVQRPASLSQRPGGGSYRSAFREPKVRPTPEEMRMLLLEVLKQARIANGDRVVVYIRSHGYQGGFVGPLGVRMDYHSLFTVFEDLGVKPHFLWLVDCCYSGSSFVGLSSKLKEISQSCCLVASASATKTAKSSFPLTLCSGRQVSTSSRFRNAFFRCLAETYGRRVFELTRFLQSHGCRDAVYYTSVDNDILLSLRNTGDANSMFDVNPSRPTVGLGEEEDWVYGVFYWDSPAEKVKRKAQKELQRYRDLVKYLEEELDVKVNVANTDMKMNDEQARVFGELVNRIDHICRVRHLAFYPRYAFLTQIMSQASEEKIMQAVDSFERRQAVQRKGRSRRGKSDL